MQSSAAHYQPMTTIKLSGLLRPSLAEFIVEYWLGSVPSIEGDA